MKIKLKFKIFCANKTLTNLISNKKKYVKIPYFSQKLGSLSFIGLVLIKIKSKTIIELKLNLKMFEKKILFSYPHFLYNKQRYFLLINQRDFIYR